MRIQGGIGALGSAQAHFFHPSANIRAKWPNEYRKMRLTGVVILGKGSYRVNHKDQVCYECRIPEINDGTIFHFVVNNFRVDQAGIIPFADKQAPTAPPPEAPAAQTLEEITLRVSTEDETRNFWSVLTEDIAELRQQGIKVDDDNERAPENAEPHPQATGDMGEWVTQRFVRDSWKNHSWQVIVEIDELAQFRMCFP